MKLLETSRWPVPMVLILGLTGCDSSPVAPIPIVEEDPPVVIVFDMEQDGQRDIYRVAPDGSDLRNLTASPGVDLAPTVAAGRVIFTSYRDGNAELYSVPLEGGAAERLTTTAGNETQPALSPDGAAVVFARDDGGVPKLWLGDARAVNSRRLTRDFGFGGSLELSPSWSGDGKGIVFVSTHEGTSSLYIHQRDSDAVSPFMVGPAAYIQPAWSPDGDWIAFASNQDGSTDLYMKHVGTGEVRRLTNRAETDAQPAWLPGGEVLYVAYQDGTTRLQWLDPVSPAHVHEIPLPAGANPRNPAAGGE
jgi:Tol biopolymer transport system component